MSQLLWYLFPAIAGCCTQVSHAQALSGVVTDASSGNPLPGVIVDNKEKGAVTVTDSRGTFSIEASSGNSVWFSLTGYTTHTFLLTAADPRSPLKIALLRKMIVIDTVEIRPGLTRYQQDSLERRAVFGKKADQKLARFGFDKKGVPSSGYGAVFNNPVSSIYQKFSRKYKRLRAFQRRFRENEQQLFLDARYTPALVQELTGMSDDSARLFIHTYAVPYDFARAATTTELNMWVKFNYRMWIKKADIDPEKK